MILPRRLMTPSMRSGALGTAVISGTRTISRTEAIRTPYVSLPIRKPTTCRSFSIKSLRPLRTRQFGVFGFLVAVFFRVAALAAGFSTAEALLSSTVENKTVHAVEQIAGEL